MLLPIRTDSPLRNTPYMNWALIVINAIMFLVQVARPTAAANYYLYPTDPWWGAFFSYAFLHAGPAHIFGNMLFLYIFGNNVNDKMGHLGYLAFYLAGGVFAGTGYVLAEAKPLPVLGASGAVAAVTGAYLVLFPRSTITVIYFFFFIGTLEIPSLWFIGLFFAKDLLGFSGQGGNVAHNAHVFGTLFGVGVCFVLLSAHLLPRDQFDVLALVSRWNKRRQYRDLVTKGYNPFDYAGGASRGGGNGKHPPPLDPAALRVAELRGAVSDAVSKHDLPRAGQLYLELKALDPAQVLPRQSQLDVANHLAGQQLYAEAAGAYEQFLAAYPKYEQVEQVQLMLGLIYARYLEQYAKAKEHLARALTRLHGQRETELAQAELARIEPMAGTGAPAR